MEPVHPGRSPSAAALQPGGSEDASEWLSEKQAWFLGEKTKSHHAFFHCIITACSVMEEFVPPNVNIISAPSLGARVLVL